MLTCPRTCSRTPSTAPRRCVAARMAPRARRRAPARHASASGAPGRLRPGRPRPCAHPSPRGGRHEWIRCCARGVATRVERGAGARCEGAAARLTGPVWPPRPKGRRVLGHSRGKATRARQPRGGQGRRGGTLGRSTPQRGRPAPHGARGAGGHSRRGARLLAGRDRRARSRHLCKACRGSKGWAIARAVEEMGARQPACAPLRVSPPPLPPPPCTFACRNTKPEPWPTRRTGTRARRAGR